MQDATDQGGRGRVWVLTLLAVAVMGFVAYMQRPEPADPAEVAAARSGLKVEPQRMSILAGVAKALLWANGKDHEAAVSFLKQADDMASSAADRFRAALLAGEIQGGLERATRLTELEGRLDPASVLHRDIETVRMLTADQPELSPSPADVDALIERHGVFGRLVTDTDPAAAAALEARIASDGFRFVAVLFTAGLGFFAATLAGFVVLIVLIVQVALGRVRRGFLPTPPELGSDRGLWLETFIVFLVAFVLMHLAGDGLKFLAGPDAGWVVGVRLLLQWSLVGVIFWPRLRGMSRERFLGELGWHRGRGVLREIGAGIAGYTAGLPILIGVVLTAWVLSQIPEIIRESQQAGGAGGGKGEPPPMPDNKVFELIAGSSGWVLVLLASLVTLWAPLVEESIFRGALFRHVRGRMRGGGLGMAATVLIVAGCFAVAHQYEWIGLVVVGTLGVNFALMREWRGSLIAPMTAHCLHNSVSLTIQLLLLPVLRG